MKKRAITLQTQCMIAANPLPVVLTTRSLESNLYQVSKTSKSILPDPFSNTTAAASGSFRPM